MYDVVVVGGGPAGSRTARLLAKDHDVLVIEEHESSGRPVQCAGLITERTADLTGVKPLILNSYRGADVVFPDEGVVRVASDRTKAIVIDRADLDQKMADAAQDSGAEYRYCTKYLGHRNNGTGVTVLTDHGEVEAKIIIGADGYRSEVASSIPDNEPQEYIRGIEYDIRHRMDHQDLVRIHIGSIAPGLFTWEMPFGEFTRVGLCTSWNAGPPAEYLKRLLVKTGLDDKEVVAKYCGKIPVGRRRTTHSDNLLLIGDAACQVKPVSAGGLAPLMDCIPYLCQTVNEAFDENNFSAKSLSRYDRSWNKKIGKELDRSYKMRKIYVGLNDDDINQMRPYVGSAKVNAILNDVDIDHPNKVLMKVAKNISMTAKMASIVFRSAVRR